jgi:hypothetical protein
MISSSVLLIFGASPYFSACSLEEVPAILTAVAPV